MGAAFSQEVSTAGVVGIRRWTSPMRILRVRPFMASRFLADTIWYTRLENTHADHTTRLPLSFDPANDTLGFWGHVLDVHSMCIRDELKPLSTGSIVPEGSNQILAADPGERPTCMTDQDKKTRTEDLFKKFAVMTSHASAENKWECGLCAFVFSCNFILKGHV